GFGLLMAKKALRNGDKVVATLRKPEVISDLAAEYTKDQLIILKLDVTKPDEINAGFEAAKKVFGRIDVVYNNAGFGIIHEVEDANEANARLMFEARIIIASVNFWGQVKVMQQTVRFFREVNNPPGGLLLNMSSMLGLEVTPAAGFYCTLKFAMEAITDTFYKELDPAWNIKMVMLCPGWFKSEL
ncbi:hypothetical protein GGX14DRAFT_299264, partial [Mycena pura]